jgi:glycosyltransferase involved in cell wall biosynthesis
VVDTADPAAIAAALARFGAPDRRAALGEAGRRAALGRFGWAGEAERLAALYRRLAPMPAA